MALIALEAAGYGADDPRVQRATKWLLDDQYEYGLWNHSAQTGFVTTAYVIRALSRLYPVETRQSEQPSEQSIAELSLLEALSRVRRHQVSGDAAWTDELMEAAESEHAYVRYQALLGMGGSLAPESVPTLIKHLDDPVKMCREAAFWSLRQLLLDDAGWHETFEAYATAGARI